MHWVEGGLLKNRFPRLFSFVINKDVVIIIWGNGWTVGGVRDGNREQVSLGRRVISRTTGSVVVTTIKLKVDDCWKWMRVADGIYSVSSAYRGLKIPSRGSQVQVNWNGIWNKYTIKGVVVHMEITID